MQFDASYGIVPIAEKEGTRLFLLVHSAKGHWDFPKGHKDKGEEALGAAKRELAEETGIMSCEILNEKPFIEHYVFDNDGVPTDKTVELYLARVPYQEVAPHLDDIVEARWTTAEEAASLITFPEGREVIAQVITSLNP